MGKHTESRREALEQDETQKNAARQADHFNCMKLVSRPGEICPKCRQGTLSYNGMLILICSNCDFADSGGFT